MFLGWARLAHMLAAWSLGPSFVLGSGDPVAKEVPRLPPEQPSTPSEPLEVWVLLRPPGTRSHSIVVVYMAVIGILHFFSL